MTGFIRVIRGVYAGNAVENVVLPLVDGVKTGKNGNYVTVNGEYFGKDRNIRVAVNNSDDIQFVAESEYQGVMKVVAKNRAVGLSSLADSPAVPVEPLETDMEVMERIRGRFQVLTDMAKAVTAGNVRSLVISGPPGVGKSHGVEQEIQKACLFDQISGIRGRAAVLKGSITAPELFMKLYEYSNPECVLVFDDCDSVFAEEKGLSLLKAALDSKKSRKISWLAENTNMREKGVPDTFEFKGSVIFITNQKFDRQKPGKIKDHMDAVMSRCHYLDLTIDSMRDKILRIRQVAADGELFTDFEFDAVTQDSIIEFMDNNQTKLREVSLRMAIKIAELVKAFPAGWEKYALETCTRPQ
jgi:hypothetical protein